MQYKQPFKTELRKALIAAFPNPDQLDLLARDTNDDLKKQWWSLRNVARLEENALGDWIDWAEAEGCLLLVVETALSKSKNRELLEATAKFRRMLEPLREVETDLGAVEKLVFKGMEFEDVGKWIADLGRIRRSVCRVEPQPEDESTEGFGTGFLIGPDLVITNWHVVEDFWDDRSKFANRVRLRFGYEKDPEGKLSRGEEYGIRPEWSLPHSATEDHDFALLRLARTATEDAAGQERKPLELPKDYRFESSEAILILQHPNAQPLKLALGAFDPRDDKPQFFWYKVNTLPGSSGGLCLNQKLQVVGLHHYGAPTLTRGVRSSAIVPQISKVVKKTREMKRPRLVPGAESGQEAQEPSPQPNVVAQATPHTDKRAFIVQSVGEKDTPTRLRADRVFDDLIGPGCEDTGYMPVLAHKLATGTITEPIISGLFADHVVIADLARPPWNSNVMIEVGFRLSTGRPLVPLVDQGVKKEDLPLHLQNLRFISIDPENPGSARKELAERIEACNAEEIRTAWESQFPFVDFRLTIGNPSKTAYLYANSKAAPVYGVKYAAQIIGRRLSDVDGMVYSYMPADHRKVLEEDQTRHYGEILEALAKGTDINVAAKIPLWFTDEHPVEDQRNKLYLPVISHYKVHKDKGKDDKTDTSIIMRVVYLDITDWKAGDLASRDPQDIWVPSVFRRPRRNYDFDVFLPYDSADAAYGAEIRRMLDHYDLEVWTRAAAERIAPADLIRAMSRSRLFALPVSRRGLGQWQDQPGVRDALVRFCRVGTPCLLLLLPDVAEGDDWKSLLPQAYKEHFVESLYLRVRSLDELKPRSGDSEPSFTNRAFRELIKLWRRLLGQD